MNCFSGNWWRIDVFVCCGLIGVALPSATFAGDLFRPGYPCVCGSECLEKCCDDYCRKGLPCPTPPTRCFGPDDYCRKGLPCPTPPECQKCCDDYQRTPCCLWIGHGCPTGTLPNAPTIADPTIAEVELIEPASGLLQKALTTPSVPDRLSAVSVPTIPLSTVKKGLRSRWVDVRGRVIAATTEPRDDVVEDWRQEDAEERDAKHAREDRRAK
ncbi:hypothetical protein Pan216_48450 [Planctomycetes bacterium Pan216]|uniref:Uncharacterized protein n=1 Tax=Kolteria novifilia TaxID=2527975 RepID=A0A518BAG1_9BACT|nr:hypothetical protein Pan216_48450 [Planctomycetes bacterium Pan216]